MTDMGKAYDADVAAGNPGHYLQFGVPDVTDVQEKSNKNGNGANLSVTLVMRNNGETDDLGAKAKAAVEATSKPIFVDSDDFCAVTGLCGWTCERDARPPTRETSGKTTSRTRATIANVRAPERFFGDFWGEV